MAHVLTGESRGHAGRTATVLVGMSAAEAARRSELLRLAAGLPEASVAFLQLADPSLSRELTRLADLGCARIVMIGVSFDRLAPGGSWLRRIAGHWLRQRRDGAPSLLPGPDLLRSPDPDRAAGILAEALDSASPVTGGEAGLESAAWDRVPGHRHQVFVCRGPRCTAKGADATAEALVLGLMGAGLTDDDVLVTHTGCQFPCNHAPVVSVQPGDVWYGRVDAGAVREIVTGHLLDGRPPARHRLERSPLPPRPRGES
ncbi:ferredoxin [Planomonospora corallina]|uniref:Ferredoxin n=1 Tax=Planomonospora corallina TaxID=1806052 RepID=A0ABV8I4N7_9ACTN